jgi:hypothetical protein
MPFKIPSSFFDKSEARPLTKEEMIRLAGGDIVSLDLLVTSVEMNPPPKEDMESSDVQEAVKAAILEEIEIGSTTYFIRLLKLFGLKKDFLESDKIKAFGKKRIARELSAGILDVAKIVSTALGLDEFLSSPEAIDALKKHLLTALSEVEKSDDFASVAKFIKDSRLPKDIVELAVKDSEEKLKQNDRAGDAEIIARGYESFKKDNP